MNLKFIGTLMLNISKPSIGSEELKNIEKVFESNWLGHGSFVIDFENRLKDFLDARHVVAVNSGTSALHLALDAIGISKGDEVIVPSLTFVASVQAITALGAKPVFCEVTPFDMNIAIKDIENRITDKTKAILPVHFCGNACDMDAILNIANKYNLIVVEDAAHAFGSSYNGRRIGSFGDITCFSFDPIKNITCGEGGAIVLQSDELFELIKKKRMLGINKDGWMRHTGNQNWYYEVSVQGYRYHMSNINAAIGLAQLEKLDSFIKRKKEIVNKYNAHFSLISVIEILNWRIEETYPFAYIIRVTNGQRNELMNYLKGKDVGTGINYIPNHKHPFFNNCVVLPITDSIFNEIITLPLYYDMTDFDVIKVIEAVEGFFKKEE